VFNTSPGPLVGVGFSNLPFSDINRFKQFFGVPPPPIGGTSPGVMGFPILGTSLDGSPGGVPLYKSGILVGGVGVTGDGSDNSFPFIADYDKDEDIALSGQQGYRPSSSITADNVFINGISLAYVASSPVTINAVALSGNASIQYPIQSSPAPFPYPVATFGGVSGQIRQPIIGDPLVAPINGQPRLTAAEVASIIDFAAQRVAITRAGIRLPIGTQMPPGPYNGLQEMLSMPPPNPNFPNGITIFPGGFPLYRNGQMIGAIGVSGDGVDQDDIVAASGTHDFLAPEAIRADQFFFRGTRLPYAKFPRDPGL
jgi:uncharacterized protein GlcG (DUF336 family)